MDLLVGLDRLRRDWALTEEEEAGLLAGTGLSGPVNSVASWRTGEMEWRGLLLLEIASLLVHVQPCQERLRDWLRRPNHGLSGASPIERMTASTQWIVTMRDMLRWIQP